jgi:ankyrin repeat protein
VGNLRIAVLLLVPFLALACAADADHVSPLAMRTVSATNADERASALLDAVVLNDLERVILLLDEGAGTEARDGNGRTPLLIATHRNNLQIAEALIIAGADVNAKDGMQDSPYLYAAAEGRLAILRLTLQHGADLRATNRFGGTGLIPAAHHGHVDTVRELLTTSVNVDHVNNLGWTALLEAIILGNGGPAHTQIVRLLVEAGTNTAIADRSGITALQHARRSGYSEIVNILEAAQRR